MMDFEAHILLPAITVLATAGFASVCLRLRSRVYLDRLRDLKIAKRALSDFYKSVQIVVSDPAVSDEIKLLLLTLSEAVPDREAARYLVDEVVADSQRESKRRASADDSLVIAGRNLAKTRPDLAEEVVKAFKSGMLAIVLRWPETAAKFKETSAAFTDERTEFVAVKKVSKFAAEHPRKDRSLPNDMVAA